MKKFKLWLDETGDFHNDIEKRKKNWNPSFIGGILIEENALPNSEINKIIPEEKFHSTEEKDKQIQYGHFEKIVQCKTRFVVFENKECIMIIDNNLTYQNIMAEGIVRLIKYLKSENQDIKLDILIANRTDTTSIDQSIVPVEEYEKRLKEKLILSGLREKLQIKDMITLKTGSARKRKELMLADIVCNTFLTRNTKYKNEQSEWINSIYNDEKRTIKFSVLEDIDKEKFYDYMAENRLGEAVAVICQSKDVKLIKKCMGEVKKHMETIQRNDLEQQYHFITALVEYNLYNSLKYKDCIYLLENVRDYFLPILYSETGKKEIADKLSLDIYFYLLTGYTHLGDVHKAEACGIYCDKLIKELPKTWDGINYYIIYQLRKVIHKINMFEYNVALSECEDLVKKSTEIKTTLEMLYNTEQGVTYQELGKILGTRVQIKTFLLRENRDLYKTAVEDSDNAIKEFVTEKDKVRQYIYRVSLETEAEQYDKALEYLYYAAGLSAGSSIQEIVDIMERNQNYYLLAAYVRLMGEGAIGQWEKATSMYKEITKREILKNILDNKEINSHPFEIIFWKWASYLFENNNYNAALEKYKKAIQICFTDNTFTINIIGLAIELERYALVLKNKQNDKEYKKSLLKEYHKLCGTSLEKVAEIFGNIDFESNDWKYYFQISRKITY